MLRWLTVAATAIMLAVNALANALPINGQTTGQISDRFGILFTPAGYVFSIWGLIYAGLIAFTVVQALPSRRHDRRIAAIRPWYIVNAVANAGWILAWHHELFGLSLAIMLVILATLVAIYRGVTTIDWRDGLSAIAVRAPFSLYLGWISIATIANTTVVSWNAGATTMLSDPFVTSLLVAFATGLCATVALRHADPVFSAVFAWATVGIALANTAHAWLFTGALGLATANALVTGLAFARGIRPARREGRPQT